MDKTAVILAAFMLTTYEAVFQLRPHPSDCKCVRQGACWDTSCCDSEWAGCRRSRVFRRP